MISGANEEQLELSNARANIVMKLDNTSTYESWLIIDTYIDKLEKENQELKKQNDRFKNLIHKLNSKNCELKEQLRTSAIFNEEDIRLDQTKKVFETLANILNTGSCSYRYLIYDLLGFKEENYIDLIAGMSITNAIFGLQELQQENQLLNQKYLNAVSDYEQEKFNVEELKKENQKLKQKYEMQKDSNKLLCKAITCDDCNCKVCEAHKENIKLNKQLEELDKKLFFTKNELDMRQKSIDNKLNQQKEFISYLEEKEKEFDILGDPKNAGACKGILRKYQEIIGAENE